MKQSYTAPKLLEYGRLSELTLGDGNQKPDLLDGVNTNTSCDNTATNVTSCNIITVGS